ncbi:MAG: 50S ribosomal protein L24 [Spirochaetia bacterium]
MGSVKLREGDTVVVTTGRDKKKSGKILRIDHSKGRVLVEGVNVVKKSQKPKREGEKGAIVEVEASVSVSNIMIKCPKCGPVRIRADFSTKEKARACHKCGGVL